MLIWVSVFVLNFSWSSAGRRRTVWVVVTVHPECLSYNVLMIPFLSYQFRPRVCFRVLRILFDWFLRTGLPISDLMSGWALQLGFYDCQILTSGRGLRVGFCNPQIWCLGELFNSDSTTARFWRLAEVSVLGSTIPRFGAIIHVLLHIVLCRSGDLCLT